MEHHYQVTFSRQHIADYDITFIRDVMSRYLHVDHLTFNRAFQASNVIFRQKMTVDRAQLCLTELEAAGINAQIGKVSSGKNSAVLKPVSVVLPEMAECEEGKNDVLTCESMLGQERSADTQTNLWHTLLPNSANSVVVVLSYLVLSYQCVHWFF